MTAKSAKTKIKRHSPGSLFAHSENVPARAAQEKSASTQERADKSRSSRALPVRVTLEPGKSSQESRSRAIVTAFAIGLSLLAIATTLIGNEQSGPSSKELTSLGLQHRSISEIVRSPRPETFEERVLRHKIDVGSKLNRQRIGAQFENMQAPRPSGVAPSVSDRDPILHGVPLQVERHEYTSPNQTVPRGGPEDEIVRGLEEEREAKRWEKRAREQFVKDFISNARAMGYDVKVDKDYNVEYRPVDDRAPNSSSFSRSGRGAAD